MVTSVTDIANKLARDGDAARARVAGVSGALFQPWEQSGPTPGWAPLGDEPEAIVIDMIDVGDDAPSEAASPIGYYQASLNVATGELEFEPASFDAPQQAPAATSSNDDAPVIVARSTDSPRPGAQSTPAAPAALQQDGRSEPERQADTGRQQQQNRDYENRSMGAAVSGRGSSQILSGSAASRIEQTSDARRQDKEQDEYRSAVREAIRQLEEHMARLAGEIAAIDKRLDELRKQEEARTELRRRKANGTFDPNDPSCRELLGMTGYSAADVQRGDFDAKAEADSRANRSERDGLFRTRAQKVREYDRAANDLQQLKQSPDSPQAHAIAERLVSTDSGRSQLGRAAALTDDTRLKGLAANAVADHERADARPESERLNADFTAGRGAGELANAGTQSFDFDSVPGATASAASAVSQTPINAEPLKPKFATASSATASAQPVQAAQVDADPSALLRNSSPPIVRAG